MAANAIGLSAMPPPELPVELPPDGVSAFTWLAFLPFATGFGLLAERVGVFRAGWLVLLAVALAGAVLVRVATRRPAAVSTVDVLVG